MVVWVLLALAYVMCVAVFIWAMRAAPRGYEDESGFHFGSEPQTEPYIDRPLPHRPRPKSESESEPEPKAAPRE